MQCMKPIRLSWIKFTDTSQFLWPSLQPARLSQILKVLSNLKPIGTLGFCQMNKWRLAISLLNKSDRDKRFQFGVFRSSKRSYLVSEVTVTFSTLFVCQCYWVIMSTGISFGWARLETIVFGVSSFTILSVIDYPGQCHSCWPEQAFRNDLFSQKLWLPESPCHIANISVSGNLTPMGRAGFTSAAKLYGLKNCRRSSVPSEGRKYQSDSLLRKPAYLYPNFWGIP